MTVALWVLEYPVSRFPLDRAVSYYVFQGAHVPPEVGACRHEVQGATMRQAKVEARVLHQRQVNCAKGA